MRKVKHWRDSFRENEEMADECERYTWVENLRKKYKPLDVTIDAVIFPKAPQELVFLLPNQSITVDIVTGSDFVVMCPKSTRQNCSSEAKWLRNQVELYDSTVDTHFQLKDNNFELGFRPLEIHHAGDYICIVNGSIVASMYIKVTSAALMIDHYSKGYYIALIPIVISALFRSLLACITLDDEEDNERDERHLREEEEKYVQEQLVITLAMEEAKAEAEELRLESGSLSSQTATLNLDHSSSTSALNLDHIKDTPASQYLSKRAFGTSENKIDPNMLSKRAFKATYDYDPDNERAKKARKRAEPYITSDSRRLQMQSKFKNYLNLKHGTEDVLHGSESSDEVSGLRAKFEKTKAARDKIASFASNLDYGEEEEGDDE